MIDSGATALFLDHTYIKKHNISLTPLRQPIDLYNIDGSSNQAGQITHFARLKLTLDGHDEWTDFLAINLVGEHVILGLPWLRKVNPHIDWQQGHIHIPSQPVTMEEIPDQDAYSPGEALLNGAILEEIYLCLPGRKSYPNFPIAHPHSNCSKWRSRTCEGDQGHSIPANLC